MKFKVIMLDQAKHDANEIVGYLIHQGERLPPLFHKDLFSTFRYLGYFPKGGRLARKGCREIQMDKFLYLLIYKFHSDTVWIHRIVHTSRKPSLRYKSR